MRHFLIAALLGAPLLIASPVMAATGNAGHSKQAVHTAVFTSNGLSEEFQDGLRSRTPAAPAVQQLAHNSNPNPLWWLQVGVGNRWQDDNDGWRRNNGKHHGWGKGHHRNHRDWNRGRHNGHRDRGDRHDRHRDRHHHRDRDDHRGHRR